MRTEPKDIPHGMFDKDYRSAKFQVGDGVSISRYSDMDAGTVVEVSKSGKRVKVQLDKATLSPDFKPEFIIGGFAGHCINQQDQTYTYEIDPDGRIEEFTLRTWRGVKVWTPKGCTPDGSSAIYHGRRSFHDYNF